MKAKSLFFFDTMLTPKVITVVYWLMLVGVLISGLVAMYNNFLTGLLMVAGGAIGVRIWCELLIVLFKINENLQKMADKPNL